MMDLQQVRELAALMAEHGLTEIRLREADRTILLRRGPIAQPAILPPAPVAPPPAAAPTPAGPVSPELPAEEGLVPINSPMVGTFYSAADPESPPYVHVGSEVEPNTTVCIIEAMKVFNEIKAETAGTIERIMVQDEQAVEYGQPLMLVRPRGT